MTERTKVDAENLDRVMEFGHVIRVHANGTASDAYDANDRSTWEPEVDAEGNVYGDNWSLMTGYTGQWSYNGPIMHSSEFIGGRMARDILETPGLYVAVVVNDPDDDEPAGWAVAYRHDDD